MKRITAKAWTAYSLLAVFMAVTGLLLYRLEFDRLALKELTLSRIRLNAVAETALFIEENRDASSAAFDRHLQNHLSFMASSLSEYASADGYTGPVLFEDGAVVTLDGGQALWPEGVPADFPALSADSLRQGLQTEAAIPSGGQGADRTYLFTPARITDRLYYVDWRDSEKIHQDKYAYLRDEEFLDMAETSLDGQLLLVSRENSQMPLVYETSAYPGVTSAAELGFTPEMIAEKLAVVRTGRLSGLCTYVDLENGAKTLIYVKPLQPLNARVALFVSIALVTMIVILVVLVTYILAILRYVKNHSVTRRQAYRYRPKNLRRVAATAGVTGALFLFVITAVCHTMDALHEESIIGAQEFSVLSEYLQKTTAERDSYDSRQEAEWYAYHGRQIASRIARDPSAGAREKLKEYCGLFGIDCIILFDQNGNETACSEDYAGLTMDAGLGENSEDFRRLLLGVPSITHEASYDQLTGLTRQYIGVKIPSGTEKENLLHGALVMAVRPWRSDITSADIGHQFRFLKANDRLFCNTDQESGIILYANDPDLLGKTIMDCGLPQESLQGGYSDFAVMNGENCFVTSVKQTAMDFYYIISSAELFSGTLPFSVQALICFCFSLTVLLFVCLTGYNRKTFEEYAGSFEWTPRDILQAIHERGAEADGKKVRFTELMVGRYRRSVSWEDKTPENQAGIILKIYLLVLGFIPLVIFLQGGGDRSLLHYILHGSWMRGANLFAFCGIVIVATFGALVVIISNALLSLIASFTGKASETICRLLYSLLHYLVILTVFFYIFDFIGLPMSTYIASLSVVSLALSIGSKDMVADIMAGLLIVFENQFQVGDIVEIDGYRGRVLDIGVRSTQLLGSGSDVRFISNSAIRTIINKSKHRSRCKVTLRFRTHDTLEAVEAFFARELPKIAEKTDRILRGPVLEGLTIVSGGGRPDSVKVLSVDVRCDCLESDYDDVLRTVTRELYLLFEREQIEFVNAQSGFFGGKM